MVKSSSLRGNLLIAFSFLLACVLSILPLPNWLLWVWPQWVPMVLIYWVMVLPHRVSLGVAWLLGVVLDGLYGSLLGEHALALCVVAYLADRMHRQLRLFPLLQQSLCVLLLILVYQALLIWINGMLGLITHTVYWFWAPGVTSMLLWPWVFFLLRGLRRREFGSIESL